MLKIGQTWHSVKFNATITILDLSEDLDWIEFSCSLCNKIHRIKTAKFYSIGVIKNA